MDWKLVEETQIWKHARKMKDRKIGARLNGGRLCHFTYMYLGVIASRAEVLGIMPKAAWERWISRKNLRCHAK